MPILMSERAPTLGLTEVDERHYARICLAAVSGDLGTGVMKTWSTIECLVKGDKFLRAPLNTP